MALGNSWGAKKKKKQKRETMVLQSNSRRAGVEKASHAGIAARVRGRGAGKRWHRLKRISRTDTPDVLRLSDL